MDKIKFWLFKLLLRTVFFIIDKKYLSIILLFIPVIVLVLLIVYPVFESQSSIHFCRICGIVRTKTVIRFFDLRIKGKSDKHYQEKIKKYYTLLVGEEHDHEWCRAYKIKKPGNLLSWEKPIKNIWHDDSYPSFQPRLTQIALSLATSLVYSDLTFRKVLHSKIINISSIDEYNDLCIIFDKKESRTPKTARVVWELWLEKYKTGVNSKLGAYSHKDIPGWAFQPQKYIPSEDDRISKSKNIEPSDFSRNWFLTE